MPDITGNLLGWILSQANGLIVIFMIIGIVGGVMKKSVAAVLTTALLGIVAFVFANNYDAIKTLADTLGNMSLHGQ